MTDLGPLQAGRLRRHAQRRRERRRRWMQMAAGVAVLAVVVLLVFTATRASSPTSHASVRRPASTVQRAVAKRRVPANAGYATIPAAAQIKVHLKLGLRSGMLFDVRSGRVLWTRDPRRVLPIASLTKMMTALIVVDHARPTARVMITRQAVQFSGSGVGLLPKGKRVPLEALLYGLLLPSGNDAAIALAQHVAGSESAFIAMMNARAAAMGLRCTHFTTVSGIIDAGNHSCAVDLAVLAHAVLKQRRLARIVATSSAIVPFPIKGGKLYLYNNNPLLRAGFPGTNGVKTGYTVAAGECLVASARRGHRWLGVVLLHSDDPLDQAERLLDRGFASRGA